MKSFLFALVIGTSSAMAATEVTPIVGWVPGPASTLGLVKVNRYELVEILKNEYPARGDEPGGRQYSVEVRVEAEILPKSCNVGFQTRPIVGVQTYKRGNKPSPMSLKIGFTDVKDTSSIVSGEVCVGVPPRTISFNIPLTIKSVSNDGSEFYFNDEMVVNLEAATDEDAVKNYRVAWSRASGELSFEAVP